MRMHFQGLAHTAAVKANEVCRKLTFKQLPAAIAVKHAFHPPE
jgi:hypothetical protein